MTMLWQVLATSVVGSALFLLAGFWTCRASHGGASRVIGCASIGILVLGVMLAIFVVAVDGDVNSQGVFADRIYGASRVNIAH